MPEGFEVDLHQLERAIGVVAKQRDEIRSDGELIKSAFGRIETAWSGPAGGTFAELRRPLTKALDDLNQLLDEIVNRMRVSHNNYKRTENANTNYLS